MAQALGRQCQARGHAVRLRRPRHGRHRRIARPSTAARRGFPARSGGQRRRLYRGRQGRGRAATGASASTATAPANVAAAAAARRRAARSTSRPTMSSTAASRRPYVEDRSGRAARRLWRLQARRRDGGCGARRRSRDPAHQLGVQPATAAISSRPCCGSPRERERIGVVDDQWGAPTFAADLAACDPCDRRCPAASGDRARLCAASITSTGAGETTWYRFAGAIMAGAAARGGRAGRVRAITTADYPTRARRPANSRARLLETRAHFGIRLPPMAGLAGRLPRSIARHATTGYRHEGNHPGRRQRHAALSDDLRSPSSCCRSTTSR